MQAQPQDLVQAQPQDLVQAQPHHPARLVVLASGNGSNLQALIDAARHGGYPAGVVAVVSDRPGSGALTRACDAGIPAVVVERRGDEARSGYDARLAEAVAAHAPDLVVLAGWMRLLTVNFLSRFPGRVINLHPALPGELPGTAAIERAWQQACAGERTATGVMIHFVPDEGVDDGPVIATALVPIDTTDTLAALTARVHAVEHRLLVDTVADLAPGSTTTPLDHTRP